MDVLFVLNELVAHLLVEISAAIAEVRQLKEHRLNEVEAVDFVLDADVERGRDGAFLVITVNVEVVVVAAIGQLMDESWVAVEVEDDWLVLGEEHVVLGIAQTMLMEGLRLKSE